MTKTLRGVLSVFVLLMTAFSWAATPQNQLQTDLVFENVAQHLELVRNQMELTIANHRTVAADLKKQNMEFDGMNVYLHIPLEKFDPKNQNVVLESIRSDLNKQAQGFAVQSVKFISPWKVSKEKVPAQVVYGESYQILEPQIADSRDIAFQFKFEGARPKNPEQWFRKHRDQVRRLVEPIDSKTWTWKGNQLLAKGRIFRFRDVEYPKMLAPDLSKYSLPANTASENQKAVAGRVKKYRQEIVQLWPEVQPHLQNLATFALNDLRMNFFLKHANVH